MYFRGKRKRRRLYVWQEDDKDREVLLDSGGIPWYSDYSSILLLCNPDILPFF